MELVALLSSGKGSWAQVSGLIKHGEWDNVIVLGDEDLVNYDADARDEQKKVLPPL